MTPGDRLLALFLFLSSGSCYSEHHSLEFQSTVQQDLDRNKRFHQTTVFDGETVFYCDDNGLRDEPRQDWVHQTFNTEDLKERRDFCSHQYQEQVTRFEEIMKIVNITTGLVQRHRGCTGNRSEVTSFDKWGLNGDDFLTFNTTTQTWEPDSELAAPVASNWNQNSDRNLVDGEFSQNWCRKILHVFVEKKAAGRKHPETGFEVHILSKSVPGTPSRSLSCCVSGPDLSGVQVQFTKAGVVLDTGLQLTGPRPNMDGTVQMRLTAEIPASSTEEYRCHVKRDDVHISVPWDGFNKDDISYMKWIVLLLVVAATFFILLFVFYKKRPIQISRGVQTPQYPQLLRDLEISRPRVPPSLMGFTGAAPWPRRRRVLDDAQPVPEDLHLLQERQRMEELAKRIREREGAPPLQDQQLKSVEEDKLNLLHFKTI
ncbi:major histocompatibility complex class I-related gene protein-like isoform X2 [Denticeps clupeoides]|uniref:major histocompatibility complex class I-related gene protein-like isoform X2 n=1 Tax=Denticeps clupeoides TaxID=299321 RepID=UPI0010A4B29D|nr:major histocompatibility complex class I-related gene protein-like isoform X2 [Denticeps clupeoides]